MVSSLCDQYDMWRLCTKEFPALRDSELRCNGNGFNLDTVKGGQHQLPICNLR